MITPPEGPSVCTALNFCRFQYRRRFQNNFTQVVPIGTSTRPIFFAYRLSKNFCAKLSVIVQKQSVLKIDGMLAGGFNVIYILVFPCNLIRQEKAVCVGSHDFLREQIIAVSSPQTAPVQENLNIKLKSYRDVFA